MLRQNPHSVDILILGAGWTSTFLIPQLEDASITHAETTTSGRDGTIPFKFDPDSGDYQPYKNLPSATTVLITFPLKGHGQSKSLTSLYRRVHGQKNHFIQLGSTGIFNQIEDWSDEDAPYDRKNDRAIAEDELRENVLGCVLNLAGLYGGERRPANWLSRIAKSKEDVKARKAVHFIHGQDVARAIIAAHQKPTPGKRWIIADLRTYDWYDLILSFSTVTKEGESAEEAEKRLQFGRWVGELMVEEGIRALPRPPEVLGRKLDARGFWSFHSIWPAHSRLS